MANFRLHRTSKGVKRWRWRVYVQGQPPRYGTCPTKECAKDCAEQAELEMRSGRVVKPITLGELIDSYIALHLPEIPRTAAGYRQLLGWWKESFGDREVSSITPQLIAAAKARLRTEPGPTGRPRQNSTVNRYLAALSSAFSWARRPEVGLASFHPVREVEKLRESKGRVRWLSRPVDEERSELERLLEACRASASPYLFDVVMLLLSTGCRENEILKLRRAEIREAEGGFTIPSERAKTEEARFVALEGVGREVVKRRLEQLPPDEPYLFPGDKGHAAGFPWRSWRTALRRAKIDNFRPHDLRHTHGSYLAMMGKTLPEIMQALGHKRSETALRYVHLADAHKRRVSADVNQAISGWIDGIDHSASR